MLLNDDRLWWVEAASDLGRCWQTDSALDMIFDQVDDLQRSGEFTVVDKLLRYINIDDTPRDLLIGYLTITLCAKHKLEFRSEFFDNVERSFNEKGINEKGLLDGLN